MKRFNYTGRKKILREDIKIRLQGHFQEKPIVDVSLSLEDYDFPSHGSVYLEPQQWKTRFMRIPLGPVSSRIRKNGIELEDFDDADGLSFKIKVVAENEGLLLGIAEGIKPYDKDDKLDDNQESILPVSSVDLSAHGVLWRIEYVDQSAILQVERELGAREQVVRSMLFRGFILPAAMRLILTKIVSTDWNQDFSDSEELSTRWLLFTQQIGAGLPVINAEDDNEEWIDRSVKILADTIGVRNKILSEYDSGDWK